ncbi:MAG: metal-dependent hydrolase [Proteobacteria bacterium]|nr:metal-dependent hydrolase [Pseudomonadota bacterium]
MKKTVFLLLILIIPSFAYSATEITWYGHSSFKVQTSQGKILLIDPWIDNPANKDGKKHLEELNKVDLILLTHAHGDHIGNTVDIAKKTGAKLVATFDLGKAMVLHNGFPEKQFGYETTGNFGGEITLLDGEVKVLFVPALHSSAFEIQGTPKSLIYGGNPGGFLISIKNGPTIYHTGDTDLFEDMKILGSLYKIDIMLICIGDKFTMGPKRAGIATKWINPRIVVPMHFGTFPVLTGKLEDFEKELKSQKIKTQLLKMNIGEVYKF